ncbi:PD40 domain-containing protein [Litchfieldia salsa]|uniref:TolB protein n=1 Tax=Litchfieldia salsa TaxID=930152 RepID=A0A1H0PSS9_9BACI|nr:PD40 domain-containing protein [Litchfieldia salsa]SDP07860.1 TolB protein [Litchfieldia salsa]
MKKKSLMTLIGSLCSLTVALVVLGVFFNKTENEKQNGLSNQYDVSSQNKIAYVVYEMGKPQLVLQNEGESEDTVVAEYDEETMILDPSFSSDGSILAYITTNKDKETELISTVHFYHLEKKTISDVFTDASTVTEVEFNPDQSSLLYLRAGTFENYSPIVGERPHNFDVYEFNLDQKTHIQKTKLEQYSIYSLNVAQSGDRVFIGRDDDSDVETAEDSFDVKQRIFEIPLENPDEMSVLSDPKRDVSIFSFTITPDGNEVIFQSISNPNDGGIYEYELFTYNLDTKEEEQLTHFGEHVGDPVVSTDGSTIYFMMDKNFAKGDPNYHLYKMNVDGGQSEEIVLHGNSE